MQSNMSYTSIDEKRFNDSESSKSKLNRVKSVDLDEKKRKSKTSKKI